MQYQRLLVQFVDPQPDYAEFGEKTMKEDITKTFGGDIHCYLYTDQVYLGMSDPAQVARDLENFEASKNIDAVIICFSKRGVDSQSYETTNPTTHVTVNGSIDDKIAGYRMELFDTRLRKSIWFSTAKLDTKYPLVSFKDLMKTFIEKSIAELKINGLVGVDNRPTPTPAEPESPKSAI